MIRVIIRSYDVLAEVALWVLLIVATAIGYFQAGVAGALIGFGVSFVFSVMAFAPSLAKDRREPSFGKPAAAVAHQGPVLRARPVTPNPED